MTDGGSDYEYDVCLSYASEQRTYVEQVACELKAKGIRVFYDKNEQSYLWGKNLYEHLDRIYREAARYCVIFASEEYARKVWTSHERESAQARALMANEEYVLPARFDDTPIPGLRETVHYIDLRQTSPKELADMLTRKLSQSFPPHGGLQSATDGMSPVRRSTTSKRGRRTGQVSATRPPDVAPRTPVTKDFVSIEKRDPGDASDLQEELKKDYWTPPPEPATVNVRVQQIIPTASGTVSLQGLYLFGIRPGLLILAIVTIFAYVTTRVLTVQRFGRLGSRAEPLSLVLLFGVALFYAGTLAFFFAADFLDWPIWVWLQWLLALVLGIASAATTVVMPYYGILDISIPKLRGYPVVMTTVPCVLTALSVSLPLLFLQERPLTWIIAVSSAILGVLLIPGLPASMLRFNSLRAEEEDD